MQFLAQDLRYALRALARAPGFTLVVVATLALGIGANTAIFSLMDQVLLRRLPVHAPEQLVQLDGPGTFSGRSMNDRTFSYPTYVDLRDDNPAFQDVVARAPFTAALGHRGQSERVSVELVSGNTFAMLGTRPALGRALTPEDDRVPGGHPLAMLGYDFWQRRFAGDPGVLGQTVTINATPMTIVGVAPPGFAGVVASTSPDLFVPLMMKAQVTPTWNDLDNRRSRWVSVVGRLEPGLSLEQAKAALDVRYRQILQHELEAVPEFAAQSARFKERYAAKTLTLHPAGRGLSEVRSDLTLPLAALMTMVGLVLLIACANVANLLLARAAARQKEIGLRVALGASRGRLVLQMLTESLVLAVLGGVTGLVLSGWVASALVAALPFEELARTLHTTPDVRVVAFTLTVSLLTAVLFGMAPALQGTRLDVNRTLRQEAGSLSGGAGHARARKLLVVAQVALSMLLVAGAGLFARSLYNLRHLDPGFDTERLVTFAANAALAGYDQPRVKRFYTDLEAELRRVPGVGAVGFAAEPLLADSVSSRTVQVQGYTTKPDEDMNPQTNEVNAGYFAAMGLPLVAGREFTERDADGAPPVAVVNETFARYYFGGAGQAVGRRFGFRVLNDPGAIEIVGVVKDALYDDMRQGATAENATPRFVYTPYAQSRELGELTGYVRVGRELGSEAGEAIRQAVRRVDAAVPIHQVRTMDEQLDRALFTERMLALLSAAFGVLATLLAAIGLYGVMAYTVARRTREIGIRIALGAERRQVLGLVLREVALLTALGIGLGVPGALGLSQLVKAQLYGLSPTDPWSMAAAAAILAAVGLAAGYAPARRAARTQPLIALRSE
jgi:predicted permease